MKTDTCDFCSMEEQYIIAENEYAYAVHFPKVIKDGHIVVTVKDHVKNFSQLHPEQVSAVFELSHCLVTHAEEKFGYEKYYLSVVGDKGDHFHVHLLPKKHNETGMSKYLFSATGWSSEVGQALSETEILSFNEQIRDRLKER